jgi:hypothetical protein
LTLPVGLLPATVAVKVTLAPAVDGLSELASVVVVGAGLTELTTCDSAALVDAALPASPPYAAVMLCVAAVRALVLHAAVLLLPLPARTTAEQPLIELAPSLKLTLPVGANPPTVAVNVTLAPTADGFDELAIVAVLVALLTTCDSAALVDAELLASPPYEATILCVATVSVLIVHAAVLLLPLPASATALQPVTEPPSAVKATEPVGPTPLTVAVNVTLTPPVDGFKELATPVVLVALLTTCDSAALLDAALPASPL